jgi:D-alanyl-D-alanine carboxypeptidase (penicillin-binding protein 5/6)
MRKIIIFIFIIMLAAASAPVYGTETETAKKAAPPEISAQTAIMVEANSGEVLYEKNADQKAYPASITKIITALLAVENGSLDKKVKVSANAAGVEGSSIYLESGEAIPLRDLVYGLMLRSGNDAAIAISEAVGGSTDRFVIMMNKRARELGAFNTNFMNPNGLHNPEHYTTARDMALIAAAAMKNPEFKKVAGAKSWVSNRGEGKYNYFYNKNKVVYQYSGGNGIKIGYTKAAGRTLVASSERDGMELICVVMNAPDWFNDTYKLMDHAFSQYETAQILAAQRPIKAVRIWGGSKEFALIGSREEIRCPIRKGAENNVSVEYVLPDRQKTPISRWQEAGYLKVYVNGKFLFSRPLQYLEDIE